MTLTELHKLVCNDIPAEDSRLMHTDSAAPDHRYFQKLVCRLRPKFVVELGTGTGRTSAQIMAMLPWSSKFVTINWPNPPSGDNVGVELWPWRSDERLMQLIGDTRDPAIVEQVDSGIDLLYIDSGTEHTYSLISEEWRLYAPKLADGAIVVCDDLDHNDMMRFWGERTEEKTLMFGGRMGMFRHEAKS